MRARLCMSAVAVLILASAAVTLFAWGAGGTAPARATQAVDSDGDGFSDDVEAYLGTDPLRRCGVGQTLWPSTAWPADLADETSFSTDKINIMDLVRFLVPVRRLNSIPGDGRYDKRWDLVPGTFYGTNWINAMDMGWVLIVRPPMDPYNGARAYNNANTCTAHPIYGD